MKTYLVGGAVRDALMGIESNDRDYVIVGATEQEVLALGYKQVGADFPVFLDENGDQWALARTERKTGVGYHGFEVTYDPTVTIEEDLSRRDLTINAIAKDLETGEIVDPYGGQADIEARMLRHVSDAFAEDPLRVIRLARFYARWSNFDIAFPTICMAQDIVSSGEMNELPDERYWSEMEKMFAQSRRPERFFQALYVFGAYDKINFFKDLLGPDIYGKRIKEIARSVNFFHNNDAKLHTFVALAAENAPQKSASIPVKAKKLTAAFAQLKKTEPTADSMFKLLAFTRGFDSSSTLVKELILSALAYEVAGFELPVKHYQITQSLEATSSVTAEKYMHLSGAEIGKAMNQERLSGLRMVFGK